MTADEMIDIIEERFPDAKCELEHETPFQLLIAVVLSAQTTDASVNKVTPALFAAYPDAKTLSEAPLADVEQKLRTIGLFRSKAKNIVELSRILVLEYDGQVPESMKELTGLPGVGRKTANVVRSVAFDIPSIAVDTHVERISKRLGLAKPADDVLAVEKKLKRKISRHRWNQAHHDLIFFGRYLCTAKKPQCDTCPLQSECKKERVEKWKKENAKPAGKKTAGQG
jgi:endonuclease-3